MQMLVFQTGLYGGDETLWDHVSPETRQRLEAFCEKYGLPAMAMSKMKPWAAAMMISTLPLMKSGMEMNLGIDKYFLDKAEKANKRVVEIESADEQMKLVSGITAEMLEKSVAVGRQDPGVRQTPSTAGSAAIPPDGEDHAGATSDAVEFAKAMVEDRNHMADVAEQFLKGRSRRLSWSVRSQAMARAGGRILGSRVQSGAGGDRRPLA
jgi:hypothetical protein